MQRFVFMSVFLLFWACGSDDAEQAADVVDEPAVIPLAPPPEGAGYQLSFEAVAPPFSEVWLCKVGPMPNSVLANVNRVQAQQNPGTHHLTLSTLGLAPSTPVEHGVYDCDALYGDSSLMQDQIMFYGNQGEAEHELIMPDGVAAGIPPMLDVIHEVHYVNTTDQPVNLYSRINAWTMPAEDVVEGIWGSQVRDETIDIPPRSTKTEWSRCVFNEDVEIIFMASHTHKLGKEFTIAPFDGQETGEIMYRNDDWHTPKIVPYDPPLVVKAGEGFEWACTYDNPTDVAVGYGSTADDEMCNPTFVHTPFSLSARCEVVETSDGVLWSPDQ
ncbi:MAG: hypothetical protein CMH52_07955 [Myxococcales bacterium]|nr:hypothetical protein [Myxococcales bacterium]